MSEWKSEIQENMLENAVVTYKYRDGVHTMTEVKANEGYVLAEKEYVPEYDDDGNELARVYSEVMYLPLSADVNDYIAVEKNTSDETIAQDGEE